MITHRPRYRVEIVDSNGSAIVPIEGGHTDPFRVTSDRSDAWGRPYLEIPTGRRGTLDRLSGRMEIGELTLRVLDARTSGDNDRRWVSAFIRGAGGEMRLKGKLVRIWESLDGTWTGEPNFFTGRVHVVRARDPVQAGPVLELRVRDLRVDMYRNVFDDIPHHSVRYAMPARLFPNGPQSWTQHELMSPGTRFVHLWNTWDKISRPVEGAHGRVMSETPGVVYFDPINSGISKRLRRSRRATLALFEAMDRVPPFYSSPDYRHQWRGVYVRLSTVSHEEIGWYVGAYPPITSYLVNRGWTGYDGETFSPLYVRTNGHVEAIGVKELPETHARYAPLPTGDTRVRAEIFWADQPTEQAPLLIKDAHPARVLLDVLLGRFSKLDPETGEPLYEPVPVDVPSFEALIADRTFDLVNMAITGPDTMIDFLESIMRVHHVGLQRRGDSKFYAIDLRRPGDLNALPLISDEHIGEAEWTHGDRSYSGIAIKYRRWFNGVAEDMFDEDLLEGEDPADVPPEGYDSREESTAFLTESVMDLPVENLTIEVPSIPVFAKPSRYHNKVDLAPFNRVAREYKWLYGTGDAVLDVTVRRVPGVTADIWSGDWVRVDSSKAPNPASGRRGGVRAGIVLSREEDGPALKLRVLDAGPDSVAPAPSLESMSKAADDPRHAVTLVLRPENCSGIIEYAVTAPSASEAPVDAAAWHEGATIDLRRGWPIFQAPHYVTIGTLPGGARVWLRATGIDIGKIDSDVVYYGYVDLDPLPTPTGLSVTGIVGDAAILSWDAGDDEYEVEVLLTTGPAPSEWDEQTRLTQLPRGSTRERLKGLDFGGAAHTAGVRFVDAYGGAGAIAHVTFNSSGVVEKTRRPSGFDIVIGDRV